MRRTYDAVVFDLDGTLLNSLDDLTDSINTMLAELGFAPHSTDEVRRFVGNGVALLVNRALPPEREDLQKQALARFMEIYKENMQIKTCPYDGIMEMLQILRKAKVRLGIASNKPHDAVVALARQVFGDVIAVAVGEGYGVPPKPATDMLMVVIEKLDVLPERTLYVGDSEVDMQTARAAGVSGVGCTWGFRDRQTLLGAGADFLVDNPAELITLAGI
jgi:phosphoglycolate phosphatase